MFWTYADGVLSILWCLEIERYIAYFLGIGDGEIFAALRDVNLCVSWIENIFLQHIALVETDDGLIKGRWACRNAVPVGQALFDLEKRPNLLLPHIPKSILMHHRTILQKDNDRQVPIDGF